MTAQRLPRLFFLYPRRYRELYGEEILQLYRDATEGAGPAARRRERFDIAAHAIRIRTHTGGRQVFGRFALAAAPYALAAAVAIAAVGLTGTLADAVRGGGAAAVQQGANPVFLAVLAAGALAWTGRWPLARGLGALTVIPLVAGVQASGWLIPLLAVVVLMPGAAAPARSDRWPAAAFAALTWLAAVLGGLSSPGLGMIGLLVPAMVVLVIRTAAPDSRPVHALAVLVASTPWIVLPAGSPIGAAVVVTLLTLAWGVGRVARPRRRAEV